MKCTNVATKVWEDCMNANLSANSRLVLLNLYTSSRRNLFSVTLVHTKIIACETELSVKQVEGAIKELEEKGLIVKGAFSMYWMPQARHTKYPEGNTYKTFFECSQECPDKELLLKEASANSHLLSKTATAALVDTGIITLGESRFTEEELEKARNRHPEKGKSLKKEE